MAAAIAKGLAGGFGHRGRRRLARIQRPKGHGENQQSDGRQVARRNALAQQDAAEDRRGDENEARVGRDHDGQADDFVSPLHADVPDQLGRQADGDEDGQRASAGKAAPSPPGLPEQPRPDGQDGDQLLIANGPGRKRTTSAELVHAGIGRAVAEHGNEAAQGPGGGRSETQRSEANGGRRRTHVPIVGGRRGLRKG